MSQRDLQTSYQFRKNNVSAIHLFRQHGSQPACHPRAVLESCHPRDSSAASPLFDSRKCMLPYPYKHDCRAMQKNLGSQPAAGGLRARVPVLTLERRFGYKGCC